MNPLSFLQETQNELKKVVWPTQKEVIRLTLLVIAVSLIVGMYIGGLDLLFVKLLERLLK